MKIHSVFLGGAWLAGNVNTAPGNSCVTVPWVFVTLEASRHLTALFWLDQGV